MCAHEVDDDPRGKLAYGIGTRWLKGPDSAVDQATTDSIKEAIGLGYRHLDGAQSMYISQRRWMRDAGTLTTGGCNSVQHGD